VVVEEALISRKEGKLVPKRGSLEQTSRARISSTPSNLGSTEKEARKDT